MLVRIAEIDVHPHHLADYKALLAEEIEASVQLEIGVMFLHAVSPQDHPHRIRMFECYASRDAYVAHLQTPHFLKYKSETAQMVRSLTLVEADPIMLATKAM